MPRSQPISSRLAYDKIMASGARESMYKKIIQTLERIGEGTSWDIAREINDKPDRVWKRQSELKQAGIVIDTGKLGVTPEGNKAIIYAMAAQKEKYQHIPKTEKIIKGKGVSDYYKAIQNIGGTKQLSLL